MYKLIKIVFVKLLRLTVYELFICNVLLYVVSSIVVLFAESTAFTLNNAQPFILSAFVSASKLILIFDMLLNFTVVSFVNGGVINAKLSCEYINVSLPGLVPVLVMLSLPQLIIKLAASMIAKNAAIYMYAFLLRGLMCAIIIELINAIYGRLVKFSIQKIHRNTISISYI